MDNKIEFEETTSYLLARVATAFRSSLERNMALIDLHAGHVFILIELWKEDGLRQIDLAKRLNIAAPTVFKTLKGLAEINLITLESDPNDGRVNRAFLTEKGRAKRDQVERQWIDLEESCLTVLREPERVNLNDLLNRLHAEFTGREIIDEE